MEFLSLSDLKEVLKVKQERKDLAKCIAGGTNFVPDMRSREVSFEQIIDLTALEELNHIKEENGTLSIGALTSISDIASSPVIGKLSPVLSRAAGQLGNPLTRNRATIGGNLANASPAADMAPPLLALDAEIHMERWEQEERKIPIDQFFLGPNKTMLEDDEIITRITFTSPKNPTKGSHFKLGLRNSMAISVVSIAVMLEMNGSECRKARVGLGAVAPKPVRAYRAEKILEGKELDETLIEQCAAIVKEDISPISDIRASAEYRKLVASTLLKRTLREALEGREK